MLRDANVNLEERRTAMNTTVDKEIETVVTESFFAAKTAARDAVARSGIAYEQHQDFFDDPDHVDRVEKTKTIVKSFFNNGKVYTNRRGLGRTKPFTVVKMERPLFPNHLTQKEKQDRFYKPLADLGVEIVFAKGSDSYLFRIK